MADNPITIIGNLLLLPQLEDQTVKDVNQALREMVGQYIRAKPPDEQPSGIDPFSDQMSKVAAELLGPGVYEEWMEGKVSKDG